MRTLWTVRRAYNDAAIGLQPGGIRQSDALASSPIVEFRLLLLLVAAPAHRLFCTCVDWICIRAQGDMAFASWR